MSSSATYFPHAVGNGFHELDSFKVFFECWISEQNQYLQELISASKECEDDDDRSYEEADEQTLRPILERVVGHYEHYYKAKSECADRDILSMFNPSWTSSFEDAFLWIGGWRPNMALHLLYSQSGLQFEARLAEFMSGLNQVDLGGLTSTQLQQVDELQRSIVREEREISEKMAKHQQTVADTSMVDLAHAMTELTRGGDSTGVADGDRIEGVLAPKEEGLVEILQRADDLRLKTLKEVINILNPIQGVHFLIAAAELHLRVHEWGKKKEKHDNYT